MLPKDHLIIAIDFDGTIVEDAYPKIGKPMTFAFETLQKLQEDGHRLILWTYRSGRKLKEAVDFCAEKGIDFYAVNENYPLEEFDDKMSRKIHADLFIDDRNVGGFLGWSAIYKIIFNGEPKKNKKRGVSYLFKAFLHD
jgi:hydroxymethylpyrimidine pyrophosphatase-like HAD family hydrolase